jgi:hypothetical protein
MFNPRLIATLITEDPDVFCEWVNSPDEALRILGLSSDFTPDQLKQAYRDKMRQNHPDVGGDTKVASDINQAYEMLQKFKPTDPAMIELGKAMSLLSLDAGFTRQELVMNCQDIVRAHRRWPETVAIVRDAYLKLKAYLDVGGRTDELQPVDS